MPKKGEITANKTNIILTLGMLMIWIGPKILISRSLYKPCVLNDISCKMNSRSGADIIGMLRHIVSALKPFMKAHKVDLSFQSDHKKLVLAHNPEKILSVIITLICRAVVYTHPGQSILLKASLVCESDKRVLVTDIHITGVNLSRVAEIIQDIEHRVIVQPLIKDGTIYTLEWSFSEPVASTKENKNNLQILPVFYTEIRRHLQSYFTKADKLVAALSSRHPKDAAFLEKVNTLILKNIDQDGFNSHHLSVAMGMSRTQLYRKLQPIIRQAPGCYIQTIRIQKAKELLETTDMRIGEVAFYTGFQTPSHFTRVFIKHYGVRPSIFFRKTKM
jgi:AraC-like DNA-binding protein